MDEYVLKKDILNYLEKTSSIEISTNSVAGFEASRTIDALFCDIDNMPAADVQPVKCGHWYHNTSKYISELDAYFIQACCSCCGKYSDSVDSYSQLMSNAYCSHCGARMDGEQDD